MKWDILFFINSILLGFALAMDAFSVSIVNGIREPQMSAARSSKIAAVYSFFQTFMPLAGWFCVHKLVSVFNIFQKWIPLISLCLLVLIGGKMIWDSHHRENENIREEHISPGSIFTQGIATSIDALSVGFVIASYDLIMAVVCSIIIGLVTFPICFSGIWFGKKAGTKLSDKADVVGGIILILVGLEIFFFR